MFVLGVLLSITLYMYRLSDMWLSISKWCAQWQFYFTFCLYYIVIVIYNDNVDESTIYAALLDNYYILYRRWRRFHRHFHYYLFKVQINLKIELLVVELLQFTNVYNILYRQLGRKKSQADFSPQDHEIYSKWIL